jgi:hypothetical protein
MVKTITQETFVPIGLAIAIIGSVTAWVTDLRSQMNNNTAIINSLRSGDERNIKLFQEINSRLSRIEWKLERK